MNNKAVQGAIALILGGLGTFSVTYAITGPGTAPASQDTVVVDNNPIRIRNIDLDPSAEPTPEPTQTPSPSPEPEPSLSPSPSPTPSDAGGNVGGGGGNGNGGLPPTSPPASPRHPRLP